MSPQGQWYPIELGCIPDSLDNCRRKGNGYVGYRGGYRQYRTTGAGLRAGGGSDGSNSGTRAATAATDGNTQAENGVGNLGTADQSRRQGTQTQPRVRGAN